MEKTYKAQKYLRIAVIALSVISILLLGSTVYQTGTAKALSQQTENHYMVAFTDLCDYVDDIDVLIKKAMLTNGRKQLSMIASQVFMESASAKANLSQLPLSDINLENTSKFLVQTGDYMMFLSSKAAEESNITDEEFNNLKAISEYAQKVSEDLEMLRDKIYNGELKFSENKNITATADEKENIPSHISKLENKFIEYPSLIYDGPFSEHTQNQKPKFLQYQRQITQKMALLAANEILGENVANKLEFSGDLKGTIPAYIFNKGDNGKTFQIAITKQGSKLLWMLNSREVGEAKIGVKEAGDKAQNFLNKIGYTNMKQTYYEKNNNVATINYAYKQDSVTIYPDLIKVKVALDNGEIIGIEASGYIMNHHEREFENDIISEEEAKNRAGKHLEVTHINLAVIPLDSGREVLCYELKGAFDDRNYLIYINAKTGEDEKILMLIESSDGILTI